MKHPRLAPQSPLLALSLALVSLGLTGLAPQQEATNASGAAAVAVEPAAETVRWQAIADAWQPGVPAETFRVTDVIDGDTIRIDYRGKSESLRLLSVDAEEKLSPRARTDGSKPETLFGEATRVWARGFFAEHAKVGDELRVGLIFPGKSESRDVYGRLLCHVVLPDGRDFNLLLVREGWSPYFTKYGYSSLCHDAFAAAQLLARSEQRGMWNPKVNEPEKVGAPKVARPYDRLLPWWEASAQALANYEARRKESPDTVLFAESADELAAALARGKPVEVFGSVFRLFEESDGSQTVLLRSPEPERALRLVIPRAQRAALAGLALETRTEEFVQNHLVARGTLTQGPRGFEMRIESADRLAPAGPEVDEIEQPLPQPAEQPEPAKGSAPLPREPAPAGA
ncbi:MAG: hypothetical protein GC161_18810 [Planctomycetaceae bacterium]|nr:hypothetical protein [Planctomycetaceae bacterium]